MTTPQNPYDSAPQAPHPASPVAPLQGHAPAYAPDGAPSGSVDATPKTGNPLGVASLIVGAGALAWQLVFVFIQAFAFANYDPTTAAITSLLNLIVLAALGLTGLILGLVALSRRDRPRVAAGIGVGLGIASTFAVLLGLVYPVIVTAIYG